MASLYQLLSPHAEGLIVHVSFLCLGPVAHLRGELACALGRRADALSHFAAALQIAERLRLPVFADAARAAITALRPAPVPKSEMLVDVTDARRPTIDRPHSARTRPG
jgi:hypothetical protein